jgi:fluoride exporter
MVRFLLVCFAGGLGTGARYLVGLWATERLGSVFPYGTLIVNVIGCMLMGLVTQLALDETTLSPEVRLILTTGFMGGFTTYSAFNHEVTKLFLAGERGAAAGYLAATVVGCALAGLVGLFLAKRLAGA